MVHHYTWIGHAPTIACGATEMPRLSSSDLDVVTCPDCRTVVLAHLNRCASRAATTEGER